MKPFNTSVLIDPNGQMAGKYSKIHAFDVSVDGAPQYVESDSKTMGNRLNLIDTNLGKIGMSICYDMRFPEIYRIYALQGADLLFTPSSFILMTGKDHWEILLRARAIENSTYVIAAGQCGIKYDGPTYGRSMIIDPWGTVLANAGDREGVIVAEIDLDYKKKIAQQISSVTNVRSDVYRLEERNEK